MHSGGMILDEVDLFDATDAIGSFAAEGEGSSLQPRLAAVEHLQGCINEGALGMYMAAATNGDGTCALHSCWGTIVPYDGQNAWFECVDARLVLQERMPEDVAVFRASVYSQAFSKLLLETERDLVGQAKVLFCGEALDLSGETEEVWTLLPENCQLQFEQFAVGLQYEKQQRETLATALAEDCCRLFVAENTTLVRHLCVELGYIASEHREALGDIVVGEYDDPAQLKLFSLCDELPGSTRFHALFAAGESGAKYRELFFNNTMLNPSNAARHGVLAGLERCQAEYADTETGTLLRRVWTTLKALLTVHVDREVPENLDDQVLWTALRQAWGNPTYWFSISEVQFVMATTDSACRIYVLEEEEFRAYRELEGLPNEVPEAEGVTRVVFESLDGCSRGHFSRLLSEETWQSLREAQGPAAADVGTDSDAASDNDTDDTASKVSSGATDEEESSEEEVVAATSRARAEIPSVADMTFVSDEEDCHCKPCHGDSTFISGNACLKKKVAGEAGAQQQNSDAEELSDVQSEVSSDDDMFNVAVDPRKDFVTDEDVKLQRVDELAALLRRHPLLPSDPRNPTEPYMDVQSGVRLPLLHCAFRGCIWTCDLKARRGDPLLHHWGQEWVLFKHLLQAHVEAFEAELTLCGITDRKHFLRLPFDSDKPPAHQKEDSQVRLFLEVISNYIQAVCVRERETMPMIGVSVDRRTLRALNLMLEDVKALHCFGCAQIFTHVPLWEKMYSPGERGKHEESTESTDKKKKQEWTEHTAAYLSQNFIEMYEVSHSLRRFFMRDEDNFRLHFCLRQFKERYASKQGNTENPFQNSRLLDEDAYEWVQHVTFAGVSDAIPVLCCPEDCKKCSKCRGQSGRLCDRCQVPLCWRCAACVVRQRYADIPMVLCNDNFWGYTTELIFRYKVRWLEAAIVSPVWTSMMVCYVEGDSGHLMNEDLQQQQFRTRVRGTAHSVHMPWEDIVEELRRHSLEKDMLQTLPRKAECLKYILRVSVRVDRYNLNKVLRQLSVRPFVLLQLLYYLIEQRPEIFRGSKSARQLREEMRVLVSQEYPLGQDEAARPEEEREWHVPEGFVTMTTKEGLRPAKKPRLIQEKHATPDAGPMAMESCLSSGRPASIVLEQSVEASTDPDALRANAVARTAGLQDGVLNVQTDNKLVPQWHGRYFSQILPFVIPFMVSGPDFEFSTGAQRWRRKDAAGFKLPAPWVSASTFTAGFARRCESQCRQDWTVRGEYGSLFSSVD